MDGRIGGWSVLQDVRRRFIASETNLVEIALTYTYDHKYRHSSALERWGYDFEDNDLINEDTEACVDLHVAAIFALGGYATDQSMNVTGWRDPWYSRTTSILPRGDLIDVCPCP